MSEIWTVLDMVRNTSSKNDKVAILQANKDVPYLKQYLALVYTPQLNYYIKKFPASAIDFIGEYEDDTAFFQDLRVFCMMTSTREVSGANAIAGLKTLLRNCNPLQRELVRYLIARDVEAGFSISTINKVWEGLIWEPGYMRCTTEDDARFEKWDWTKKHYVQLKADGMFVNVIKSQDDINFMTRSGNMFPRGCFSSLAWLVNEWLPKGVVVHGELLVVERGEVLPRTTGNGILNSVLQGEAVPDGMTITLLAWDMVSLEEWRNGQSSKPYSERFGTLCGLLSDAPSSLSVISTHVVDSVDSAKQIALDWMKEGYEGAIVKNSDGVWKDHTSPNQVKLKVQKDVTLKVIGFNPGSGKNKDLFGSLRCTSEDGNLIVDVGGFTDKQRKEINNKKEYYLGKCLDVLANCVLDKEGSDVKSLFLPRFIEWRLDRVTADTLPRALEVFSNDYSC